MRRLFQRLESVDLLERIDAVKNKWCSSSLTSCIRGSFDWHDVTFDYFQHRFIVTPIGMGDKYLTVVWKKLNEDSWLWRKTAWGSERMPTLTKAEQLSCRSTLGTPNRCAISPTDSTAWKRLTWKERPPYRNGQERLVAAYRKPRGFSTTFRGPRLLFS